MLSEKQWHARSSEKNRVSTSAKLLLLGSLPYTMREQFLREYDYTHKSGAAGNSNSNNNKTKLESFLNFLDRELIIKRSATNIQNNVFRPLNPQQNDSEVFTHQQHKRIGAFHTRVDQNQPPKLQCIFCNQPHPSQKCRKVLSIKEKKQKIGEQKARFKCLKKTIMPINAEPIFRIAQMKIVTANIIQSCVRNPNIHLIQPHQRWLLVSPRFSLLTVLPKANVSPHFSKQGTLSQKMTI